MVASYIKLGFFLYILLLALNLMIEQKYSLCRISTISILPKTLRVYIKFTYTVWLALGASDVFGSVDEKGRVCFLAYLKQGFILSST